MPKEYIEVLKSLKEVETKMDEMNKKEIDKSYTEGYLDHNKISVKKNASGKKRILIITLIITFIIPCVLLGALLLSFVTGLNSITVFEGRSMLPTLNNSDRLLAEKFTLKYGHISRGDIVVIDVEKEYKALGISSKRRYLCKRIIGIEGDHIQIIGGEVHVNEKILNEKYIKGNTTEVGEYSDVIVPKNHIYVLGDNRDPASGIDSRYFGPVDISEITGRIYYRIFPFNKFGAI